MDNCVGTVILRCEDNCTMLVVDKYKNEYEEMGEWYDYNVSMQDSYLETGTNGIKGRIRRAVKILFGKPVVYNDIWVEHANEMVKFRDELNKLIEKE